MTAQLRSNFTEAEAATYWECHNWMQSMGIPLYNAFGTMMLALFMEKRGVARRDGTKTPNHYAPVLPYRIIGNAGTGMWCAMTEPGCNRGDVMIAVAAQLFRVKPMPAVPYSSGGNNESLELVWPRTASIHNATVADDGVRSRVADIATVHHCYDYEDMRKPATHIACLRHLANHFLCAIKNYESITQTERKQP